MDYVCLIIWWTVAIAISCGFCISRIIDAYHKWERSPVIVSFATTQTPIWQIPFPALTICPDARANPHLFNYTAILHKKKDNIPITEKEQTYFEYMAMICDLRENENYTIKHIRGDDIYDFFEEVKPHSKENFNEVTFMGNPEELDNVFMPILTEEGVCYTFNMLDREVIYTDKVKHFKYYHTSGFKQTDWTLEKGYRRNAGKEAYPKRALFAGALAAFDVNIVIFNGAVDYACTGGIQGYKVQIHHPAQTPSVRQQYFRVPLDQFVVVAITPNMMITNDNVKNYSPKKRECYFPSERKLYYFKFYTQQNCQIECKTNYTLAMCDCVDFYMPHTNKTAICGAASIECTMFAEYDLLTNSIDSKLETLNNWKKKKITHDKMVYDCDCLPTCISIDYSMELSQNEWDWEQNFKAERYAGDNYSLTKKNIRLSHLRIFFKMDQFIPSVRHQLYGTTELFANFGGLLGLCLGFSVLSFVEIIYFLSVRLLGNVIINGRRFWAGINNNVAVARNK